MYANLKVVCCCVRYSFQLLFLLESKQDTQSHSYTFTQMGVELIYRTYNK